MSIHVPGLRRTAAAVVAASLLLSGCASEEKKEPRGQGKALAEGFRNVDDSGEPSAGGTLTYGAYTEPASLDPTVTIAAATTGGNEMANIFDTLTTFDPEKQEFVPRLAESIEPNSDFTSWTLTLREDVTFSDGTPLDAEAVVWSQQRYAAAKAPETALWNANVTSTTATDALTVTYDLARPWPLFPGILSTGPGMVVAKSSVGADGRFTPVGAGPFTLGAWKPGESIDLEARADYWDGAPHLDSVRMAFLGDQRTSLDSLVGGDVDAALVRDPDLVDEVLDLELPAYVNMRAASNVAIINAAEGAAGHDPRVRKAIALAIDPELMRERMFGGAGIASSDLFPDYSVWHTDVAGLAPDREEATKLVEEAKADGWDGVITYVDGTDPASRAATQAVKASLEAVGMTLDPKPARTISEQITRIAVERDYDLAGWSVNFVEADPYARMFALMSTTGTQTYGMYTSPAMDEHIAAFQAATTRDDQLAAVSAIQEQVNEDVPFVTFGPYSELSVWNKDVHGITGGANSIIMLDDAWVD
ncbi:ABC transporter substrate-binding protein [Pimelobacter simplex]|uniref:ABC transporter substrate-binding protein n=1 Tax=Nocardioides simplex TaxID=2045 RepID=UPI0019325126|nr:ABC transporter substrate-binding protein [Pimelobacter simplex]